MTDMTPEDRAFLDAFESTTLPPERRILPEAKTRFVEPDLAPLPRIVGDSTN